MGRWRFCPLLLAERVCTSAPIHAENLAKIAEHRRTAEAAEEEIDRLLVDAYGLNPSDQMQIVAPKLIHETEGLKQAEGLEN